MELYKNERISSIIRRNKKQSEKCTKENKELVYNAIKTPDGTVLVSRHTHDFKVYEDKNGETYINDGGTDYLKRSVNKEPFEDLALYTSDSIKKIREIADWGTYGKDGVNAILYQKIKDLSNAHLEAILNDCGEDVYKGIIKRELDYRLKYRLVQGYFPEEDTK